MSGTKPFASRTILADWYRLEKFDTIDSTNAQARKMAMAGAAEGTVVWALEQTEGRGRSQNEWASPNGGLYASLILRPDVSATQAAQISFVVANVVHKVIASILSEAIIQKYISAKDADLLLKWPNDILLNRKKVGGILLESSVKASGNVEWVVAGLGINVESHPEEGTRYPATSLHSLGITDVSAKILLSRFLHVFAQDYTRWQKFGFDNTRNLWLHHAAYLGDTISIKVGEETRSGIFKNIDEDGALVLELSDGTDSRFSAGEVFSVTSD